jgi:hypothetical protein
MKLIPRDWIDHQHYKDRNPPWIKLHKKLLNNRAFMCLPLASKALAPLLWLLASESKDGTFLATYEELEFRLRITRKDLEVGLKPLIDNGFFSVASIMLAECLQVAPKSCSETETETETETDSGFVLFWSTWPKSQRKQAMGKCKEVWVKGKFEKQSAEIVAHVAALKVCDDWQKNNGQFIPAPIVYLNGRRWEGASDDRPTINEFAGAL